MSSSQKIDPIGLVKSLPPISSLPEIINQLEKEFNNPYSSIDDVGYILQNDPNLTARLLRLANSAFYGFSKKIESASQAITVVGLEQLKVLLLGISVIDYFDKLDGLEGLDMQGYWDHSVACGIAARSLAILKREANPDPYFVMGLIHSVGKLVFFKQIPELAIECTLQANNQKKPSHLLEAELIGFDNAFIAGLLLAEWEFPERLCEAASHQHKPQNTARYFTESTIINISNTIVHAMDVGCIGELSLIPPPHPLSWEKLNIDPKGIGTVIENVDRQFSEIKDLFFN